MWGRRADEAPTRAGRINTAKGVQESQERCPTANHEASLPGQALQRLAAGSGTPTYDSNPSAHDLTRAAVDQELTDNPPCQEGNGDRQRRSQAPKTARAIDSCPPRDPPPGAADGIGESPTPERDRTSPSRTRSARHGLQTLKGTKTSGEALGSPSAGFGNEASAGGINAPGPAMRSLLRETWNGPRRRKRDGHRHERGKPSGPGTKTQPTGDNP
jgi:hypothetical protein